jgi:hypothetical protein
MADGSPPASRPDPRVIGPIRGELAWPARRPASGARKVAFRQVLAASAARAPQSPATIRAVPQKNPAEYESAAQAAIWGGSTCSAASLTAVLRGRGLAVRIADVMKAMPGGMTPELGLVSRSSLVRAAHHFGLRARDDVASYAALERATAGGQPVLLDVTNARFPEGHWLVATGVDAAGVRVVDSSGHRLTHIPRAEFTAAWSGRGIRIDADQPVDTLGTGTRGGPPSGGSRAPGRGSPA